MSELYIGLMSGTSVDGIDAALVDFSENKLQLIDSHYEPIRDHVREQVSALCTPGDNEIDRLGALDIELGELFAQAVNALLEKAGVNASQVQAIGSHGQTIRHRPPQADAASGFTLQIGDPNYIASNTGIPTVADFRRRDMAEGGQGAPFGPAFHRAMAPRDAATTAFLNLGGIANLTLLHNKAIVCGMDTGPANGLMDAWINQQLGERYDINGDWAKRGQANPALLAQLQTHPFFNLSLPKSTGRETFSATWLNDQLNLFETPLEPVDVQATLLQLSVQTIYESVKSLPRQPNVIYVCGGGASNAFLMQSLARSLEGIRVATTAELNIHPDWVEACAFAWLARERILKRPVDLTAVTGANVATILGAVYER
ncbi:MAG: anhydro-N-acetylmuramic acid kinase [Pseudomonadales bacterium]|nr:anhydro-N-acetylmuramic acid kinase [Pseudomonadales bacterium]